MERALMDGLIDWKTKPRRKPLIINGARQVGKTWLIKEFGRKHFKNVAYVTMDNNEPARILFEAGYDIPRIISGLQLLSGEQIVPEDTLIVFDEIQEIPKALTSLKYFNENAPEYAVIAAGSLLGVRLHEGESFPVGKVETLDLYPLSFQEFVHAVAGPEMADVLRKGDFAMMSVFRSKLIDLLRQYYFVGGMPEAVRDFIEGEGDYEAARAVQKRIVADYDRDFSKHLSGRDAEKAFAVWDSIPTHLSHENKKFVFGRVAKGARARDFENAITWLTKAGLVYVVPRVSKPGIPLKSYRDHSAFKVFLLDVGLLGAMVDLDAKSVLEGNKIFEEFKGTLTEQHVCQELIASCGIVPFYWSAENSSGELDFLAQDSGCVYAIEVKAEENLRAKSLKAFKAKHPEVQARRFSMSDYREEEWLTNVPLYAVGNKAAWEAE